MTIPHSPSTTTHTTTHTAPLRMVEMVFPDSTNHYGTMFGGKVLDLMDRAAFLATSRFSRQPMVTASMEHIDFIKPIKSGEMVELVASIVHTGRCTVTVKVDLYAEHPVEDRRRHACRGYFHMVSVNDEGRAIPVPTLLIHTPEERAEWDFVQSLLDFRKQSRREKA